MKKSILYLAALFICFCSCENEKEEKKLDATKIQFLNKLGNRYLELDRFSGVILVAHSSSVIYQEKFGMADYEKSIPFTDQTPFKIGEISELITSQIIYNLEQEQKLKLTDKISRYIPEIKADFTVEKLLNHETGLPSIKTVQEKYPSIDYSTIGYVNLGVELIGKQGYSDLGFNVLGLLIEEVSGKDFQENLKDHGMKLGLENTFYNDSDLPSATGYLFHNYRGNGLELQKSQSYNNDVAFSSIGLKSTAVDLMKVLKVSSRNKIDIDGFLKEDGFSYSVYKDLKTQISIIILSNRKHPVAKEISKSIQAILKDENFQLPLLRKQFQIDENLLKDYVGTYSMNKNMSFEVVNEAGELFVLLGPNKVHLIPQASNQFFMKQNDAAMRFLRNKQNKVYEVELLDGFLNGGKAKKKG